MNHKRPGPAPRAARAVCAALLALSAAGCLDFVAPEFTGAGAPATFNGAIRVVDGAALLVDGRLVPGRAGTGFLRAVPAPELLVLDTAVAPVQVTETALDYQSELPLAEAGAVDAAGPVAWRAPVVEGVGEPPAMVWYPYRPVAPDTFSVVAGQDVVVRVLPPAGATTPAPDRTSWFVTVVGAAGSVRVSADGVPPETIRIPPAFLPEPAGERWRVRLQVFEQVGLSGAGADYQAQLLLETRFDWLVDRLPSP